jgi:hypothetical protein
VVVGEGCIQSGVAQSWTNSSVENLFTLPPLFSILWVVSTSNFRCGYRHLSASTMMHDDERRKAIECDNFDLAVDVDRADDTALDHVSASLTS